MSSSEIPSVADRANPPLCFDLSQRTRLQMSGADRVKFLHNLSTAEIKKLPPGQGCETFIPTLQGRILGHFFALPTANTIILSGVSQQADAILPHFQKYAVIEDVEVVDRTGETSEFLVAGPHAASWIQETLSITPPASNLQLVETENWILYRSCYVSMPAWGVIFLGETPAKQHFDSNSKNPLASAELLDHLRVEAGFPYYGRDITSENLAQEADRNASAISFTKGCYLGQETIARIDALGHVNRRLLGVKFAEKPSDEATYEIDGKSALTVTSIAYLQEQEQWIGLAMVRRGFDKPGQTLQTSGGAVEVVALPFSADAS